MPNSSSVRAGQAYIEITGEDKTLRAALDRAQSRMRSFGAVVRAAGLGLMATGAAITAPLIAAAKASAESGAAMYDMSKRTGISAENLSTLGFAANATGASVEGLEAGIKRMQKTIAGVEDVVEGTTGSLAHLGLAAADVVGLSPDQQFRKIAAAIAEIQDPTARAAAAMKVFGRQGTDLLPMIQRLGVLENTARGLGFVKTDASVAAAKQLELAFWLIEKASKSVWGALQSAVVPILTETAKVTVGATLAVRDFIKQHREAVTTAFRFGAAMGAVGAVLVGTSMAISLVGQALGVVTLAMDAMELAAGAAVAVVNTIATGGIGLALLAIGAAALSAGVYFTFATETGRKMLSSLGGYFKELGAVADKTLGGVTNALAAGDWKLAADVAFAGLKLAWAEGTKPLREMWVNLQRGLVDALDVGMATLEGLWSSLTHTLSSTWISFIETTRKAWEALWFGMQDIANVTGLEIMKGWNTLKGMVDSSFDAKGVNAALDQGAGAMRVAAAKAVADKIAAIENGAKAEQIAADKAALEERLRITKEFAEKSAQNQTDKKGEIAAIEDELKRKRAELDNLRLRAWIERKMPGSTSDKIQKFFDQFFKGGAGGGDGDNGPLAAAKLATTSTFSTRAVGLLAGGDGAYASRTATATEKHTALLTNLVRLTQKVVDTSRAVFH